MTTISRKCHEPQRIPVVLVSSNNGKANRSVVDDLDQTS